MTNLMTLFLSFLFSDGRSGGVEERKEWKERRSERSGGEEEWRSGRSGGVEEWEVFLLPGPGT